MGRRTRTHFPHAMYHVMLRGNNRQNIFLENTDYQQFLTFLEQSIEEFAYKIYAYCLMKNHVHLAIEVNETPLSKIIQIVAQRYAYWFNHKYKCIGHLFHGRYKAIPVQTERYTLDLCKYIHLNPIRANIVKNLEQYPWNSHSTYLGTINTPWLSTDLVFALLRPKKRSLQNNDEKITAYRNFIATDNGYDNFQSFLEITTDGKIKILSVNQVVKPISLTTIIEVVCRNLSLTESDIFITNQNWQSAEARAIIALCVKKFGESDLTALAKRCHRDIATLCNAIKRLENRQRSKPLLAKKIAEIKEELVTSG